ncbi:MAG: hypothetical protein ISS53_05465 [Dehalococcoidia bacterium]|nr:hypothetical protein [Dehalococcoidia bacterium]
MEGIWVVISVLAFLLPILVVVALVNFVRGRGDQRNGFNPYQALINYFYLVTGASVITMAVGLVYLCKVAVSRAFDGGEIADDLTLAFVLLGTGMMICILHVFGRRAMEKREDKSTTTIRRRYLFFMLAVSSITGLVSLPLAIYRIISYHIVEPSYFPGSYPYYEPPLHAPSAELAVAIVFVPLWAYYLFRVLREIRHRDETGVED